MTPEPRDVIAAEVRRLLPFASVRQELHETDRILAALRGEGWEIVKLDDQRHIEFRGTPNELGLVEQVVGAPPGFYRLVPVPVETGDKG